MKTNNIIGKKFNRWTVLQKASHKDKNGKLLWVCQCDCGEIRTIVGASLKSGNSKSCGCWKKEQTALAKTTHGKSKTRLYSIWLGMKKRCENPHASTYKNYGARGISVCTEWKSFEVFQEWAVSHGYLDNLSIDRIDVNGNYEPLNCRWVSDIEQKNNKRNNHYLTVGNETKSMADWSKELDIPYTTLRRRIALGWPAEKAISTPPFQRK